MTWNPKIKLIEGEVHCCFLGVAYINAWRDSDDPITKNGAIIVNDGLDKILGFGANHFPQGITATEEQMQDRKWKYKHIIHAEPAAIFDAAKRGNSTEGATMYMPWVPCTPCAKAIIDSGITRLIGHEEMIMKTPERWWEDTDYALTLLEKAGVERFMYQGKIDSTKTTKSLFNGQEWYP